MIHLQRCERSRKGFLLRNHVASASAAISTRLTASHPNSEVKLVRAGVVLRWGTTREGPVLRFFFRFRGSCCCAFLFLFFFGTPRAGRAFRRCRRPARPQELVWQRQMAYSGFQNTNMAKIDLKSVIKRSPSAVSAPLLTNPRPGNRPQVRRPALRLHPSLADAGVTVTRALRRAQWTQAACCAAHAPLASEGVQDTRECAGRCWGCLCTCGWRVGP